MRPVSSNLNWSMLPACICYSSSQRYMMPDSAAMFDSSWLSSTYGIKESSNWLRYCFLRSFVTRFSLGERLSTSGLSISTVPFLDISKMRPLSFALVRTCSRFAVC